MSWLRRHPLGIAYALIVATFAFALWGVQHEAEMRRRDLCETVNDQQAVLEDLIVVVLDDDGQSGLRLTQIPEFAHLDERTQEYLLALEAASSRGDGEQPELDDRLRVFAAQRLIPADCSRGGG